jgi:N-methylhydantoinase A/oxoprolinase/acetone carboxylase beta subunit
MVVRGDGALISAAEALMRPIETILSGPAASLVGARHLTGLDNAVVSDIGGTTTDVAVLEGGHPRLDSEGATVGRYRTMVEAVAMHTFGLGGDSELRLEDGGFDAGLILGPRRLMPLSLAAHLWPQPVLAALERQAQSSFPGRYDGRFALRTGLPKALATGLSAQEARFTSV